MSVEGPSRLPTRRQAQRTSAPVNRSDTRVLQQCSHQLKRHSEDSEADGEERECANCDKRPKVHASGGAQEGARVGGAHNQPLFMAVWNFDPELSIQSHPAILRRMTVSGTSACIESARANRKPAKTSGISDADSPGGRSKRRDLDVSFCVPSLEPAEIGPKDLPVKRLNAPSDRIGHTEPVSD
jgi:hypothetical protein